jgi:hypothetical protein
MLVSRVCGVPVPPLEGLKGAMASASSSSTSHSFDARFLPPSLGRGSGSEQTSEQVPTGSVDDHLAHTVSGTAG